MISKEQTQKIKDLEADNKSLKEKLEKAMQSEKIHRLILSNIQDAIMLTDEEGYFTFVCPNTHFIFGYSADEIHQLKHVSLLVGDDLLNGTDFDSKKEIFNIECQLASKDGMMHDLLVGVKTVDISSNKRLYTFHEVTEIKRLQNELRQTSKYEAIGTLAGGIAHDFNNILSIIIGNTELTSYDIPEWHPAHKNLDDIMDASMRARNVIRQLLKFIKKSEYKKKPIRLSQLIRTPVKLLRSSLASTIEIKIDIQEDVDLIFADPSQINQIILNLCHNASHAMNEKGGVLTISLRNVEVDEHIAFQHEGLALGKYVRLSVEDTGCGMDPQIRERIFDPYFTTKDFGDGSGLGLSVVHGIVEICNGVISVQSAVGKGSVFEIFFPVVEEKIVLEKDKGKEIPTGIERILFIDDEISLCDVTKRRLERLGYTVDVSMSSIDALEKFRSEPNTFDLVITDMTMPDMDGYNLSEELLKTRFDIPIIICTGFSGKIDQNRAREIGIQSYIEKPLDWYELAVAVRNALDN